MMANHKRRRPGGRRSGLYRVVCGQWLRACSGSDQEADIRCNREAELPNQSARGLVTKKTNNIGLVVEDTVDGLENTILLDVVKGLGEATETTITIFAVLSEAEYE